MDAVEPASPTGMGVLRVEPRQGKFVIVDPSHQALYEPRDRIGLSELATKSFSSKPVYLGRNARSTAMTMHVSTKVSPTSTKNQTLKANQRMMVWNSMANLIMPPLQAPNYERTTESSTGQIDSITIQHRRSPTFGAISAARKQ